MKIDFTCHVIVSLRVTRSESPVCEELGSVTYLHHGEARIALQTRAGGLLYEGRRFKSVSDWLRSTFQKKL
jgi:hypothetical protein